MRRQTNTINYSTELPLAQGVEFDLYLAHHIMQKSPTCAGDLS